METISKLKMYENFILAVLNEYADPIAENDESYRKIVLADKTMRHYQLLAMGWTEKERFVDNILIHLHIKSDGKIWLLENNTEIPIAQELVNHGIPKTDIVLGFHPPQYRAHTGYAVA